jgi:hypothetical protein
VTSRARQGRSRGRGRWRRRYPADRLRTRPTVYVRGMPQLARLSARRPARSMAPRSAPRTASLRATRLPPKRSTLATRRPPWLSFAASTTWIESCPAQHSCPPEPDWHDAPTSSRARPVVDQRWQGCWPPPTPQRAGCARPRAVPRVARRPARPTRSGTDDQTTTGVFRRPPAQMRMADIGVAPLRAGLAHDPDASAAIAESSPLALPDPPSLGRGRTT